MNEENTKLEGQEEQVEVLDKSPKKKKEKEPDTRSKKRKIIDTVFTVLQIVLIAVFLTVSILLLTHPNGNAYVDTDDSTGEEKAKKASVALMNVQTDSMSPTFNQADLIFGKKVSASDTEGGKLPLGIVVTFVSSVQAKDKDDKAYTQWFLNSHRLVGYCYYLPAEDEDILDGEGQPTGAKKHNYQYFYMHDGIDTFDKLKAQPGKSEAVFDMYLTSGDKYTLARRNYADGIQDDAHRLYNADGSQCNFKSVKDLNGDYRIFGSNDVDGKLVVNGIEIEGKARGNVEELTPDKIIGKWNNGRLVVLGHFIYWLTPKPGETPIQFVLVVWVPLLLLFGYNVYLIIRMIVSEKQKKAVEEAKKEALSDKEEIKRQAIAEYLASLEKEKGSESEEEPKDEE